MFIQTESTPNPATLKFLPGRTVMGEGAVADFPSAETAGRSPLARALFATPEVSRVFFGSDFISVTKKDGDWKHLKPAILGTIMEHFTSGAPLMEGGAEETDDAILWRRRSGSDRPDQGTDRDAGAPGRGAGWRRHHLQGL